MKQHSKFVVVDEVTVISQFLIPAVHLFSNASKVLTNIIF